MDTTDASTTTVETFDATTKNGTNTSLPNNSWDAALIATEVIVIALMVGTVWISLSMIVYGTKTKRWRKNRGTSSLNSGMIYTTCFIAITFTLVKLCMTLIYHHLPRLGWPSFPCESLLDVMSACYFFGIFLMYLYLWMVQRRIYTHPSVKTHVASSMNGLSKFSVIAMALVFTAVAVVYAFIENSRYQPGDGCMLIQDTRAQRTILSMACGAIATVMQIFILILCIYPAIRARFPVPSSEGALVTKDDVTVPVAMTTRKINFCTMLCRSDVTASPIQLTVNRTVIGSFIIVISDILSTIIESFMLTSVTPLVLHTVVYDINYFVNSIAMLYVLGFAGQLLTLFCPTCPQSITVSNRKGEISRV